MSKEIKDRIDRILAQHDAAKEAADRDHARSAIGQAQTNISGLQGFLWQFAQGLAWTWRNIGRPVAAVVIPAVGWLFGWYVRLWGRLVTVTNQYGDRVFSYKRAGVMVLATALGLYFASALAQLAWDAGWYAYNGGWEQVYLRSPQELSGHPGEDVHAVRGCEHSPSCTSSTRSTTGSASSCSTFCGACGPTAASSIPTWGGGSADRRPAHAERTPTASANASSRAI